MRRNKHWICLILLTVALAIASCNRKTIYHHYEHTPVSGWEKNDTLQFNIPAAKERAVAQREVELRVTGAYPFYDGGETETSPKGLVPIRTGDKLDFVCDFYGADGSYQSSHKLDSSLTVAGELTLENLSVTNNVIPSYRFTDIYGNHYWITF